MAQEPSPPKTPTARRRKTRAFPQRTRRLLFAAFERLGLSGRFFDSVACLAFAEALHRVRPSLEPHARAEALQDRVLVIRVAASAVSNELTFVRDLVLDELNRTLAAWVEGRTRPARTRSLSGPRERPAALVDRLVFRVGSVAGLPSYTDWHAPHPQVSAHPRPVRRIQVAALDSRVAKQASQVRDPELRAALGSLFRQVAAHHPSPDDRTESVSEPKLRT